MNELTCIPLRTDDEIRSAYPLMAALRTRIRSHTFLADVRRQQAQGYELVGGFARGRLVALAGVRRTHTLARGDHLFVDDLVTDAEAQGRGHATALLRWLARRAAADHIPRMYLDSRDTARGFYASRNFRFLTSLPCWIDIMELAGADAPQGGGTRP